MAFAMDTGVENVVSIKVIGVGGGGNNVVNLTSYIYHQFSYHKSYKYLIT